MWYHTAVKRNVLRQGIGKTSKTAECEIQEVVGIYQQISPPDDLDNRGESPERKYRHLIQLTNQFISLLALTRMEGY